MRETSIYNRFKYELMMLFAPVRDNCFSMVQRWRGGGGGGGGCSGSGRRPCRRRPPVQLELVLDIAAYIPSSGRLPRLAAPHRFDSYAMPRDATRCHARRAPRAHSSNKSKKIKTLRCQQTVVIGNRGYRMRYSIKRFGIGIGVGNRRYRDSGMRSIADKCIRCRPMARRPAIQLTARRDRARRTRCRAVGRSGDISGAIAAGLANPGRARRHARCTMHDAASASHCARVRARALARQSRELHKRAALDHKIDRWDYKFIMTF